MVAEPEISRAECYHLLEFETEDKAFSVLLDNATQSVGRDPSNTIALDYPSISRQHAILLRIAVEQTENYIFRILDGDLQGKKSTNGIFINGRKETSCILKHGDLIVFGKDAKATYYNFFGQPGLKSPEEVKLALLNLHQDDSTSFETVVLDQSYNESAEGAVVHLASFPELIPHPIFEVDVSGKITYLNPKTVSLFPDIREKGCNHPLVKSVFDNLVQHIDNPSFTCEVSHQDAYYEAVVHFMSESDLLRIFVVDITARKRAELELQKRDQILQVMAQVSNHLLLNLNCHTALPASLEIVGKAFQADYLVLCKISSEQESDEHYLNFEFEWFADRAAVTVTNQFWIQHPCHNLGITSWLAALQVGRVVAANLQQAPQAECFFLQASGIQALMLVPLTVAGQFWGFWGIADCHTGRSWGCQEEVAFTTMAASIGGAVHRQQVEDAIRHQALHDALTNLPNRVLFNEQLDFALKNARRTGNYLAVMFLDLDRFKLINDTLGHTIGDCLLQQVARRFSETVRDGDVVARWGGDEFIILIPHLSHPNDIHTLAKRLLKIIDQVFEIDGNELFVTSSIGIAFFDDPDLNAETLIKRADIALYHVKEQGRNGYRLFEPAMDNRAPELLTLEKDLRQALSRQEFQVLYQPRINLLDGSIDGMEALLRWHHPAMGMVSPGKFIPIAEDTGLILSIGKWVLQQACFQNKQWQQAGLSPIRVAVNLSPKQFRQSDLIQMIQAVLTETGLDPIYLELEITESIAIQDIQFTQNIFIQLSEMGVHLSIDDFGTGHSSLSRLQNLPINYLKIDKSFVQDLDVNQKVSHIIKTIVALGKNLGLKIVAEGVETEPQLDFLKSIECESAQGFFFYCPISVNEATHLLRNSQNPLESLMAD